MSFSPFLIFSNSSVPVSWIFYGMTGYFSMLFIWAPLQFFFMRRQSCVSLMVTILHAEKKLYDFLSWLVLLLCDLCPACSMAERTRTYLIHTERLIFLLLVFARTSKKMPCVCNVHSAEKKEVAVKKLYRVYPFLLFSTHWPWQGGAHTWKYIIVFAFWQLNKTRENKGK